MANSLGVDLTDKWILLKTNRLAPQFHPDRLRLVHVDGGLGAAPIGAGAALMVTFHADGKKARMNGYAAERIVEGEELTKLQHLNDVLRNPPDLMVTVEGSDGTIVGTIKLGDEYSEDDSPEERAARAAAVAWNFLAKNAIYKVDGHSFTASDCAEWWA